MNKKTGRPQYSTEQKLLMIAAMLPHNRDHESAAPQASQTRDCIGRFSAGGVRQCQGPSLDHIARRIAVEQGVSASSVWHWYSLYSRGGGYAALSRKRRADSGRSIFLDRKPELRPAIDARLSEGLSPFAAWKSLRWMCGFDAPSYGVVLRYAMGGYRPDGESPAQAGSAAAL